MNYIKVVPIIRYTSKLVLTNCVTNSVTNSVTSCVTNNVTNPWSGKKICHDKNLNKDCLIEEIVDNCLVGFTNNNCKN